MSVLITIAWIMMFVKLKEGLKNIENYETKRNEKFIKDTQRSMKGFFGYMIVSIILTILLLVYSACNGNPKL